MRSLILVLALILSFSFGYASDYFWGTSAKYIYKKLSIDPEIISGGFEKSIGGLGCARVVFEKTGSSDYTCEFNSDSENYDAKAIYSAMNVEPRNVGPSISGKFQIEKKSGSQTLGLRCVKPNYSCSVYKD
jgi:hypothetical protein